MLFKSGPSIENQDIANTRETRKNSAATAGVCLTENKMRRPRSYSFDGNHENRTQRENKRPAEKLPLDDFNLVDEGYTPDSTSDEKRCTARESRPLLTRTKLNATTGCAPKRQVK